MNHNDTFVVGRVDCTEHDVEMTFGDAGIGIRDMLDYFKYVEPMKLAQSVHSYPAPSESKLIYPHTDDEVIPEQRQQSDSSPTANRGESNDNSGGMRTHTRYLYMYNYTRSCFTTR